ncbi:MAG: DUF983 domain-containing protein [Alphaproteobacteria bacterium]|nr:MAG: DUF983 domain-containing protein [Alphaproteobacteria bacterium]
MTPPDNNADRPLGLSIRRGILGKCPACGIGNLFRTFLSTHDLCPHCGEEIFHHRADDGPPFFSMFFVAPIVVTVMIIYEGTNSPPIWHHLVIGITLSITLCIGLIRPIKGFFVGVQWAKRMHGFGTSKTADQ